MVIRSISGLLYASLIISSALHSDLSFIIVIFVFSSLALYEFQKLIEYKSPVPFILFGIIVFQFYSKKLNPYLHLSLLGLCVFTNLILAYFLFTKKKIRMLPIQKTAATLFYIVASGYFIITTSSLISLYLVSDQSQESILLIPTISCSTPSKPNNRAC